MKNEPPPPDPGLDPIAAEFAICPPEEQRFQGLGVSPGIAFGPAFVTDDDHLPSPEYAIAEEQVEAERKRLAEAVQYAVKQLKKLKSKSAALPNAASEELGYLLDARLQMLSGSRLVRGADRRIGENRINAEAAVRSEIAAIMEGFSRIADPYLAARAADVREVGERVIRNLLQAPYQTLANVPAGSVVLAEELTPADTALLQPDSAAGFATVLGGAESHTAIMARSLGIPAVLGVAGLLVAAQRGQPMILDGGSGLVIVNPTAETIAEFRDRQEARGREQRALRLLRDVPAETIDAVPIQLCANIELPRDAEAAEAVGASGVGLYRTEFMFMNRSEVPDEDEQYGMLRAVVERMEGRPVTIRTLDVGGDKLAPAIRESIGEPIGDAANPALGVRGIRLSLGHPKLLEAQIAAILRAGAHGPVRILLPMISHVGEVLAVRETVELVQKRLRRRRVAQAGTTPPIGVMIEVPGAALAADALATASDFFALGTNDLTMYTLAIDRGDERVAALYNPLHPAVLRLIQFTVEAGLRARVPVSVCGEIAGDPRYTALLVGLGVRDLSMAPSKLLRIKQQVRALDLREATRRAGTIMDQWDQARIGGLLDDFNAAIERRSHERLAGAL